MPGKDKPDNKANVEATKMMRAATALKEDTSSDIHIPDPLPTGGDVDEALMGAFEQTVVRNTAKAAVNMAKTEALESEIKLREAEKKHQGLENPQQSIVPSFPASGLGGTNSRAAIIQSILSSLDPSERSAFIKENQEMLLSPDTPYASLFAKAKGNGGNGGSGGNSPMEMAAVMATLGEEQRSALAFALQMANSARQSQPAPAPQPQQDPMAMFKLISEMQTNLVTSLGNILKAPLDELRNEIKVLKEAKAPAADDTKWQQEWLKSKEELLQLRHDNEMKEVYEAIGQLQNRPRDADSIPIKDLNLIKSLLKEQGMTVGAQDPRIDDVRRKWDIEDRRLTLEESRRDREHQEKMAEFEVQKANREVLKTIAGGALEFTRVGSKVLSGGSESSRSVSSRRS